MQEWCPTCGNIPLLLQSSKKVPAQVHLTISLTPIPCMLFERIIARTLYVFLDEYILLDEEQYGFRARRSVTRPIVADLE